MSGLRRRWDARGFTLVEMLVVLGVIALLAGILVPVLSAVRRASANTKCVNNLRQIGIATLQYMGENLETLPVAVTTNTWEDPASPRGAQLRPPPYQHDPITWWRAKALPVAYYLDSYLRYDIRVWRCPGTKVVTTEPDRFFRTAQMVESDPNHTKDDVAMWTSKFKMWRPGYMYMSTIDWKWFLLYETESWRRYWMAEWDDRSIAGLRLPEIRTLTRQTTSEVVLFYDYHSTCHGKSGNDVFEMNPTIFSDETIPLDKIKRAKFQSNFLYVDGHVETRRYEWLGGLVNQFHTPVGSSAEPRTYRRFPD